MVNNMKKSLNVKYAIYVKEYERSYKIKDYIIQRLGKDNVDYDNPKYVFSIGGDGTYLKALHNYIYSDNIQDIVFININTGNLGFYSNLDEEDIDNLMDNIIDHQEYVYHDLIEFRINDEDKARYCMNEICLYSFPEAVKLDCYVDGNLFESFCGSGLVVSSPTGSTGLNKSLNGAIIDERLKTLQITEVAGIKNKFYKTLGVSTVLDSKRVIDLIISPESSVKISYDNIDFHSGSEENFEIKKINVRYSDIKIKNLKYKHKDFFERVKKSFLEK